VDENELKNAYFQLKTEREKQVVQKEKENCNSRISSQSSSKLLILSEFLQRLWMRSKIRF
jgi:hypothetical protein